MKRFLVLLVCQALFSKAVKFAFLQQMECDLHGTPEVTWLPAL